MGWENRKEGEALEGGRPGSDADSAVQRHISVLDKALFNIWNLGENLILVWTPRKDGIDVLDVPHYLVGDFAAVTGMNFDYLTTDDFEILLEDDCPRSFIEDIITGPKQTDPDEMKRLANLLKRDVKFIPMPGPPGDPLSFGAIEALVKRYSLSYVEDRAVFLFDIVDFSLFCPLEQVTQLNSLSHSLNSAHSKLMDQNLDINFARTTTGDGFYIWNRDPSIQANVHLYHFMHLVMADNAIARRKSKSNAAPELRTCFHMGGHYEFYQSEALRPTDYSYIVGDVTIELARMIEKAMPGQVVVGNFQVPMLDRTTGKVEKIDSVQFIEKAQETLGVLKGMHLSGEEIESINCYLTGPMDKEGNFNIKKYLVTDKHGRTRNAFNAKINIYRKNANPIYLGVQDQEISEWLIKKKLRDDRVSVGL